jgi:hypothetical protein
MKERKNGEELNLLVLDDLLISLDLHNRKKVVDLILSNYSKDYQIIILTHDKGFFNEMLRQINDDIDNWTAIRLYETALNENPKVEFDKSGNLDRAIEYYAKRDYESCSLYLRKEAEETLSKYLDPDLKFIWSNKEWRGLAEFLSGAEKKFTGEQIRKIKAIASRTDITDEDYEKLKGQIEVDPVVSTFPERLGRLTAYKRNVFDTLKELKQRKAAGKDVFDLIERLKNIKDRVLNAGAHFSEAPFYQEEIEEAILTIIELRKTLTNQIITRYTDACKAAGMNI